MDGELGLGKQYFGFQQQHFVDPPGRGSGCGRGDRPGEVVGCDMEQPGVIGYPVLAGDMFEK